MRRIAFAGVLLFTSAAGAQTLYKCVAHGSVSYQQRPCPTAARTVRTIEFSPEAPPSAAVLAAREIKARQDRTESQFLARPDGFLAIRRGAGSRSRERRGIDRRRNETACPTAKTKRERTLGRVGFDRNIDLLRKLDEDVADACRRQ